VLSFEFKVKGLQFRVYGLGYSWGLGFAPPAAGPCESGCNPG
jgi:hypothetical protein